MRKILSALFVSLLLVSAIIYAQGTGTPNVLRVLVDTSNNLVVTATTLTGQTTGCVFINCRLKTDASGNLVIVLSGGVISGNTVTDCLVLDVANQDTKLCRDAAGTFAQRNGTNPQTFRVYFSDNGADDSFAQIRNSGSNAHFEVDKTGAGTAMDITFGSVGAGDVHFKSNGSNRWKVSGSNGHFLGETDNTFDIGAVGANRPRTGYFGTSIVLPLIVYPGTTPGSPNNGETWIDTAAGNWTTAATTINLKARNNAVTRTIASVTF